MNRKSPSPAALAFLARTNESSIGKPNSYARWIASLAPDYSPRVYLQKYLLRADSQFRITWHNDTRKGA